MDRFYPDHEIIVVNDGSTDQTAAQIRNIIKSNPKIALIDNQINRGKGAVVKQGILSAKGNAILFMDADGSTAIDSLTTLLSHLNSGADVVISSRRVKGAEIINEQPTYRIFLGWIFRKITQWLTHLDIIDTQNGFKLFRGNVAKEIFSKVTINGWAFDVEALVVANHLGFICEEVPIVWQNDSRSKVKLVGMIRMLADLIRISINLRRGAYDMSRAKL